MKFSLFLCLLLLSNAMMAQSTQQLKMLDESVTMKVDVKYQYLLHTPKDKSTAQDGLLPLLIFLHGAGERGNDADLLTVHGPPKLIKNGTDLPFIVLSPQCAANERWDAFTLKLLIDRIVATHPVDQSRIYLTGLSMGGFGTWDLAIAYPDYFAAIAPICGGSDTHVWDAPGRIKDVPTWAFHGAMDRVVPVERTTRIIASLRRVGGTPKLTIYESAGHDSWTETYDNQELYQWFLSHTRGK